MSRRIEVNRLDRDELIYELAWRGIAVGTVDEMQAQLVLARQMEKSGESLHYPSYPFSFKQDAGAVTRKLDDLVRTVGTFSDTRKSGIFLKLQTKLSHILGRIDNMVCASQDETDLRAVLLAQTLTLIDQLNNKANLAEGITHPIPPNLCVLQSSILPQQPSADPRQQPLGPPLSSSSFVGAQSPIATNMPLPSYSTSAIKPLLPHKWNLKFSGDKKSMSVTAFFERVEELRKARNVTKEVLLESGIDLFVGRAYEFYQDVRTEVTTWDELVVKFKEEYQPAFYSEHLLEEIKRRTQGSDETIGTYAAVMSKYFQRLQCPISEEAKLNILLRNISPMYRSHLGAMEITSLAQLKTLCRRIEQRVQTVDYSVPSKRIQSLEPDLAYISLDDHIDETSPSNSALLPGEQFLSECRQTCHCAAKNAVAPQAVEPIHAIKPIVCWNCQGQGHLNKDCPRPRKMHCYRCGQANVTVRNCPNCSNSGNASRGNQN